MNSFSIAVRHSFTARHYLHTEQGAEAERHSHSYQVELEFEGATLDGRGYLMDLIDVQDLTKEIEARYAGQVLNDLPEFAGVNPSIEHFARIVCELAARRIQNPHVNALSARVWENDWAWARCRKELS